MSSYQGDDDAAEYMEDVDDEMENVEVDDVGDEFRCGNFDDDDLAASEEFDYSRIPWVMLSISREKYRQTRLQQYKNYENVPNSGESSEMHPDRPGVSFCSRTTYDDNAITNAIEIYNKPSGALHFTASNNDSGVRDFDMERYQLVNHFSFSLASQCKHASLSPNGKLLAIIGDNPEGLIVDPNSGKTLETLSGHVDYSFASAWHPDGTTLSTGNQDKTCRVWDIRNLSQALAVLKGNIGAIRSIRYTSVGSTWPWLNLLTLSMSTTFQKVEAQTRLRQGGVPQLDPGNSSVKDPLGYGDAFN
ncbi:hypothetical protein Bca101_089677 [Brassica carinata]